MACSAISPSMRRAGCAKTDPARLSRPARCYTPVTARPLLLAAGLATDRRRLHPVDVELAGTGRAGLAGDQQLARLVPVDARTQRPRLGAVERQRQRWRVGITLAVALREEQLHRLVVGIGRTGEDDRLATVQPRRIELIAARVHARHRLAVAERIAVPARDEQVVASRTAETVAGKQQRLAVATGRRRPFVALAVDPGTEVLRVAEAAVRAHRDPVQVVSAHTAIAVGEEVQPAPVGAEGRIEIVRRRVDRQRLRVLPAPLLEARLPQVPATLAAGAIGAAPDDALAIGADRRAYFRCRRRHHVHALDAEFGQVGVGTE